MSHICKVRIRKITYDSPEMCPFMTSLGIRELARRTGLDASYLSRVKNGVLPINTRNLRKLYDAQDEGSEDVPSGEH